MTTAESRIPVLIVGGFLGSGKTTLIRHLLHQPALGEVAVIVNEFGEVGIDHQLVRKTDERTVLLHGGCVCCGLREDLVVALGDLLSQRQRADGPHFARVVLETTGLADPAPILHTIASDPVLRHHYRVEQLVTTIDAVAGPGNLRTYDEATRQIAAADQIVVTKQDLAPVETTAALKRLIRRINPSAPIIESVMGEFDATLLVASQRLGAVADADLVAVPSDHAPGGRVWSHCIVLDQPLDWSMFGLWLTLLLHRHGGRVLRVKGLLNVGREQGPLLLDGVQHVIHAPRHLAEWPDGDRRTRIVFILRDLEPARVAASLATFQEVAAA